MGAVVKGEFNLVAGEKLKIAVGQMGITKSEGGGGGGASFVVMSNDLPLLIAGGGGGTGDDDPVGYSGIHGSVSTSGNDGSDTAFSSSAYSGTGGQNGLGAVSKPYLPQEVEVEVDCLAMVKAKAVVEVSLLLTD